MEPQETPLFFQRAELEAERTVREWIRKTLRETFVQMMQRHLTVTTATATQQQQQNEDASPIAEEDDVGQSSTTTTVVLQMDNLAGCLAVVEKVSQKWQERLRNHQHRHTADWVEDVHTRGKSSLWSIPVPPRTVEEAAAAAESSRPRRRDAEDETGRTGRDVVQETEASGTSGQESQETSTLAAIHQRGPLIPYCALRYMTRPCLKQPHPFQTVNDPVALLRQFVRHGVSDWPLDASVIDDLAEEIPKRQRWERTGKKDVNVQVVVPRISDGQGNATSSTTNTNRIKQDEEEEESQRVFSQVLARNTSKIKVPRFRRKRRLEAQRQADRIQDVPRLASSVGSATYHVPTSLSEREKEDALRYVTPDSATSSHPIDESSTITIFGELEDLGKMYRLQEVKKEKRPHALTDRQQRRRETFYVKERILPRRAQKNHDPGKYKSKIMRTEQVMDDGTIKSFLDFDLGWTMIEFPDNVGERRLMMFSNLQVVVEETTGGENNQDSAVPNNT